MFNEYSKENIMWAIVKKYLKGNDWWVNVKKIFPDSRQNAVLSYPFR